MDRTGGQEVLEEAVWAGPDTTESLGLEAAQGPSARPRASMEGGTGPS